MIIIDLIIILVVAIFVALTWRISRFLRRKAGHEGRWWRVLREAILMIIWFLTLLWIAGGLALSFAMHFSATPAPYSGSSDLASLPLALPLIFVLGVMPVWVGVIALREILYWYKSGKLDGFPAMVLGATVAFFCFSPIIGGVIALLGLIGPIFNYQPSTELNDTTRAIGIAVLAICAALIIVGTFLATRIVKVKGGWGAWFTFLILTLGMYLLGGVLYAGASGLGLEDRATQAAVGVVISAGFLTLIDVFLPLILILKWAIGGAETENVEPEAD